MEIKEAVYPVCPNSFGFSKRQGQEITVDGTQAQTFLNPITWLANGRTCTQRNPDRLVSEPAGLTTLYYTTLYCHDQKPLL